MSRRPSERTSSIAWGAFLTFSLHGLMGLLYLFVLVPCLAFLGNRVEFLRPILQLGYNWYVPLFFPGLAQFIYLLPFGWWLYRRGDREVLKGMVIGALLTIFLNGTCFAWIAWNARG